MCKCTKIFYLNACGIAHKQRWNLFSLLYRRYLLRTHLQPHSLCSLNQWSTSRVDHENWFGFILLCKHCTEKSDFLWLFVRLDLLFHEGAIYRWILFWLLFRHHTNGTAILLQKKYKVHFASCRKYGQNVYSHTFVYLFVNCVLFQT